MLKEQFQYWLKIKGYSEYTPKGLPSTVYDYPKRIEYIIWYEKLKSWQDVVININRLLKEYDENGIKSEIGKKSHSAVINALRRFNEFCIETNQLI